MIYGYLREFISWELAKSRLIRKDLDAGKDWRQEEKGTTEDEMAYFSLCLKQYRKP